ncbi:MAG: HAD-IA family hydrolase [Ignavibacteriae bacterium]|nr:HAD family hydrolase [Ignavibacteriota bacterium]NOG99444.1 HAD-IA family hydrolase [Ignavibacteriota bacterium]
MRKFDGFIFDIDGTLASTNELIFSTFRHITKRYLNSDISDAEIINLFGPTEDEIIKIFINDNFEEARKDYYEFYRTNHAEMADVYPGLIDVLDLIKEAGIPLSIYTGKGRKSSIITLTEIGVIDYFDLIMTGDDVAEPKPSRLGIDPFIEKFNLDRDRVLMIGDSPADIIAAREANVKIASVVWDAYAKDEVLKMNPDYLFHSVDELYQFIKESI